MSPEAGGGVPECPACPPLVAFYGSNMNSTNATPNVQHNCAHLKKKCRRSKKSSVRVNKSSALMHPEFTLAVVAGGGVTKRTTQPRKARNDRASRQPRKGWQLHRISAPQNNNSFIMMSKMAKTPHSAFLSPATNRGSLSNVLTPGTEKTLTVDGTAALPTIDCFGSMQGLIVPAKERPRGSPDDEEALAPSSDVEDRVNGFLLVKEERTTGDDRGLQAQLTTQSSYISTLEEDNQRLRERIQRLETELREAAQHAIPQTEETDGETNQ